MSSGPLGSPNNYNGTAVQVAADAAQAAAIAAAAAAEIVADAARASYLHDDYILSGAKTTLKAADGQVEEFFSVTALAGTVQCTTTPLKAMISGKLVTVSADTGVTIANGVNVVYLHQDGSFTVQATFPTISKVAPAAPAAHDHWYDMSGRGVMYKYSGSAWVATPEIPVAYAYATGGAVVTGMYGSLPACTTMYERRSICGEPSLGDVVQVAGSYPVNTETVFRSLWIVGGADLTHGAENQGYQVARAQWVIAFDGTSTMNLAGLGNRKATAGTGAGAPPVISANYLTGLAGGGGGSSTAAGGNSGTTCFMRSLALSNGALGGAINTPGGNAVATKLGAACRFRGMVPSNGGYGAGGPSGAGDGTAGGDGGAGGGCLPLIASVVHFASGAGLNSNGANGVTPGAGNRGGGVAGAGGFLYFYARQYVDRGATLAANPGTSGSGSGTGGAAGTSSAGVVRKESWS